jgi:hypothetical protein
MSKSLKKVKLGNKYKDKVSGFIGVAVSKHTYLNGCARFTLQPESDKEGKLPSCETFDEPQLELIKKGVAEVEPEKGRTGGPSKYEDTGMNQK